MKIKTIRLLLLLSIFSCFNIDAKIQQAYVDQADANFFDQLNQSDQDSTFYCNAKVVAPSHISSQLNYDQIYTKAICDEIQCRQFFHMTLEQKRLLLKLNYNDFVHKLLSKDDLSDQAIWTLWHEYKNKRLWDWDNEKFENEIKIKNTLKLRQKHREQQNTLAQQHSFTQLLPKEIIYLKSAYELPINNSKNHTIQKLVAARELALQQTENDNFKQYDASYTLTPQAQAYLKLHDINATHYHNFYGTTLQQQLHYEICSVFEQAAILQHNIPCQSNFLQYSVMCADAAHDLNKLEQIQMVVALNNLSFQFLNTVETYSLAAAHGALSGLSNMIFGWTQLPETIECLAKSLHYVFESCALSSCALEYGFEDLFIELRDARNEEITMGLQALGQVISKSTGPERVEALVQFAVNFRMPTKIVHALGGVLGVTRSQATLTKSAQAITTMVGEQIAASETTGQLAQTLQKAEIILQEGVVQQTAKTLQDTTRHLTEPTKRITRKKISQPSDSLSQINPQTLLDRNLKIAESRSLSAIRTETLPDGRIRYYGPETLASTPGPTRGSTYVTEYDPTRGRIRGWYESRTHTNQINRVHPKMIDGENIDSLHYPHTKKELENIAQRIKGNK